MGCNARDRIRRNSIRNIRLPKQQTFDNLPPERFGIPPSNPNPNFDETNWGYCTEDQLEELLLKNLDFLYNEAMSKLIALGYDEEIAFKAVLRNGHCYGNSDVLSNIVSNAVVCLRSGVDDSEEEAEMVFVSLRQLEEYSLACMVCLLQQARPQLSKGDAMWCLLMSDLHVGRARSMEIPVLSSSGSGENGSNSLSGIEPGNCKFHGGWGFGSGEGGESFQYSYEGVMGREIECPKRFDLSPSLKSMLQRNVAMYVAGFRASAKTSVVRPQEVLSEKSEGFKVNAKPAARRAEMLGRLVGGVALPDEVPEQAKGSLQETQNLDVKSVLSSLDNLRLEEKFEDGAPDPKKEMIQNLIHQVRDLEGQVKERKEWAHQKAMQAAKKLSQDMTELKMLRMEREETQWLKKGKQTLEDTTMKGLSEMEDALRKASGQVDRANAAVRRLENENAEIRAEMEASKLNASESIATCLQVAKREKKCVKKLLAWEKQKSKFQDEIALEKQKISQLQQQLVLIKESQKKSEAKWRHELKEKELAFARAEEERRSKAAVEVSAKRQTETLHRKIEIDFQRHKDDIQRLEQELSRLRASVDSDNAKTPAVANARLHNELNNSQNTSDKEAVYDRGCMICKKDEASVVFLPCAHQVLCASCSQSYGKKGRASCPCCRVQIEQRISVYGASS